MARSFAHPKRTSCRSISAHRPRCTLPARLRVAQAVASRRPILIHFPSQISIITLVFSRRQMPAVLVSSTPTARASSLIFRAALRLVKMRWCCTCAPAKCSCRHQARHSVSVHPLFPLMPTLLQPRCLPSTVMRTFKLSAGATKALGLRINVDISRTAGQMPHIPTSCDACVFGTVEFAYHLHGACFLPFIYYGLHRSDTTQALSFNRITHNGQEIR